MKKTIFTTFAACSFFAAFSQTADTTKKEQEAFKLSGSADVYYKYNFNRNRTDNKTSFTNSHNSFELGMASLKVEHGFKKGSIVADLGFGRRAAEFSYNDTLNSKNGIAMAIKQLYVSYQVTDKFKVSLGSYATHVGYELVDAYLNRNYSMSYMFSNGPFFNTGVKLDYAITPYLSAMIGLFNPTDLKSVDFNENKYIGAQIGYTPTTVPMKLYLNYLEGKDSAGMQNHQLDFVATYQVNTLLGLGYNGTFSTYRNSSIKDGNGVSQSVKWWGSALYINMDFTETLGLTLRGEYFEDKDRLKTFASSLEGGHVIAGTLTFNYKVGNLTIMPEFRLDNASRDIFNKHSGAPTATTSNVLLAATYHF